MNCIRKIILSQAYLIFLPHDIPLFTWHLHFSLNTSDTVDIAIIAKFLAIFVITWRQRGSLSVTFCLREDHADPHLQLFFTVKKDVNLYHDILQICISNSDVWREIRIRLISVKFISSIYSDMWVIVPIINTECGKTQLHLITVMYFLKFGFASAVIPRLHWNGVLPLTSIRNGVWVLFNSALVWQKLEST